MVKDTDNFVIRGISTFLSDKPIWVWWLSYIVTTGVLFGIFYLAFYLLTIQAWVAVLILLLTGIIWGSIAYAHKNSMAKERTGASASPGKE